MAGLLSGFCIRFMGCSRIPYLLTLDFAEFGKIAFFDGNSSSSSCKMAVVDGNLEVTIGAEATADEQSCSYILVMDKPQ